MKTIEIAGKKFKLASRFARLFAFFMDGIFLTFILFLLYLLLEVVTAGAVRIVLFSILLWKLGTKTGLPKSALVVAQVLIVFLFGPYASGNSDTLAAIGIALGTAGLFLMDGLKDGQGFGKKLLSLQVRRLKDGSPGRLKDSFIRRFTGIFQPFDFFWSFSKNRQRLGDKLADTVVVKFEPEPEPTAAESEPPEKILERAIAEMNHKLSEAREKVDASVGVEKQFQDAYEGAVVQADRWQERAIISLEAGREDLAREDLEKRNEYRKLAAQYKNQWGEQKQIVRSLNNLLEHFQQKIVEAEGKKAVIMAQHRNINAEAHLREMLKEMEDSETFETFAKTEQEATEVAALAKAAVEVDTAYQDMKLEREFTSYVEEASLDKDLAALKTDIKK